MNSDGRTKRYKVLWPGTRRRKGTWQRVQRSVLFSDAASKTREKIKYPQRYGQVREGSHPSAQSAAKAFQQRLHKRSDAEVLRSVRGRENQREEKKMKLRAHARGGICRRERATITLLPRNLSDIRKVASLRHVVQVRRARRSGGCGNELFSLTTHRLNRSKGGKHLRLNIPVDVDERDKKKRKRAPFSDQERRRCSAMDTPCRWKVKCLTRGTNISCPTRKG